MTTLNVGAMRAVLAAGDATHAATDVTGFGLLGHLHTMLLASGCAARVRAAEVPVFDGVSQLVRDGAIPGGTERNIRAAEDYARWIGDVDRETRIALCDAQTSGGMLVAVAPTAVESLIASLTDAATPIAAVVGTVTEGKAGVIEVTRDVP